ncbi:MAG: ABC transporter ATP-binding protein/permease [Ruminococcus sp.]|jgi:ABC-type multidrug transport system fused ATPase/permease subunit|nr:ABC transporter ATP-binding protein/permease [Ruminococcus sp.]
MKNLLKRYRPFCFFGAVILIVFLWFFGYGVPVTIAGVVLFIFTELSATSLENVMAELNFRRNVAEDNDKDIREGADTVHAFGREEYENFRVTADIDNYSNRAQFYLIAKRGQQVYTKLIIGIAVMVVLTMTYLNNGTESPLVVFSALAGTVAALCSIALCRREITINDDENSPEKPPEDESFVINEIPENPRGAEIEAAAVTCFYDENPAVNGITLKIKAGERFGIIGRTNSGKTSLLNIITRKILPNSGEVYIDGAVLWYMTETLVADIFANRIAVFDNEKPDGDFKGKTVIIASQKTSDVMDCDRIAVLDTGMIDAIGTHETLLSNNCLYRDLYTAENPGTSLPPMKDDFSEILGKME